MKLRPRALSPFLTAAFLSGAVACAVSGAAHDDPAPSATDPTDRAQARAADLSARPNDEEARAQAFLDARYKAADVRHSFRTTRGQTVDCVDFRATPGGRALAAQGEPLSSVAAPPPARVRTRSDGSKVVLSAQPAPKAEGTDEDGQLRLCPEGTVTTIRVTKEEIALAGGLDAYKATRQKQAPPKMPRANVQAPRPAIVATEGAPAAPPPPGVSLPAGSMWPCEGGDFTGYAHVLGDLVDNISGVSWAQTSMAVYAPSVPSGSNHSLSQFWLFSGENAQDGSGTCTSNCIQSIEAGWIVLGGGAAPQIFIFSTLDGYSNPGNGCYVGDGPAPGGSCPTFVQMSGLPTTVTPWAALAYNAPEATSSGKLPVEMTIMVELYAGNYWLNSHCGRDGLLGRLLPGDELRAGDVQLPSRRRGLPGEQRLHRQWPRYGDGERSLGGLRVRGVSPQLGSGGHRQRRDDALFGSPVDVRVRTAGLCLAPLRLQHDGRSRGLVGELLLLRRNAPFELHADEM